MPATYLKSYVLVLHNPLMIVPTYPTPAPMGWLSRSDLDLLAALLFSIIDLDLKHGETPL